MPRGEAEAGGLAAHRSWDGEASEASKVWAMTKPQAFAAALSKLPAPPADLGVAAALLAVPLDAAAGIDFHYGPDHIGYLDHVVSVTSDPYIDAARLAELCGAPGRDLSADPRYWVGWYRSGARLYTSGLWILFGVADVTVPSDTDPALRDVIVDHLIANRSLDGPVSVTYRGATIVLDAPKDPATGYFRLQPSTQTHAVEAVDAWDAVDAEAARLCEVFGTSAAVVPISLGDERSILDVELVFEVEGCCVVVPVSSDGTSIIVGIPQGTPLAPATEPYMPAGFTVMGRDPLDGSFVARHETGILAAVTPLGRRF